MKNQIIGNSKDNYLFLKSWLRKYQNESVMLVCGSSFDGLKISKELIDYSKNNNISIIRFSDFKSNPDYCSVVEGVNEFNQFNCQAIIAVGGGSAIDVAKCIKLFHKMNPKMNYLYQEAKDDYNIDLFVVPTTAGTGSEATRFAVIYYDNKKQSVTSDVIIPNYVLFDSLALSTLPDKHRKSSMLDALCHAIESLWSVNSNSESLDYSKKSLKLICCYMEEYLSNSELGNNKMLEASYWAGKAINITQTTAGHAMCYKLTSVYDVPHGLAAALCVEQHLKYLLKIVHGSTLVETDKLKKVFKLMCECLGCNDPDDIILWFSGILDQIGDKYKFNRSDIEKFVEDVNINRLNNHPVKLEKKIMYKMYYDMFNTRGNCYEC